MSNERAQSKVDESSQAAPAQEPATSAPSEAPSEPVFTYFPELKKTTGRRGSKTWPGLFESAVFQAPSAVVDKRSIPGWSPAIFRNDRRAKSGVEAVTALVLDYDAKLTAVSVDEAAAVWGSYFGAIHTTWSSTKEQPCFRVILPFTRPVTSDEYAPIWEWARAEAESFGHKIDPAAKDASRLWFLPAVRPGAEGEYRLVRLPGAPLEPDLILAAARSGPSEPPVPEPLCGEDDDVSSLPADKVLERAKSYLAKMPPAIQGQFGSRQTFKAALAMVRGFALEEQQALDLLLTEYNTRCQPPWASEDLARKVADAAKSDIALGYLLKARRPNRPLIRITTEEHDVIEQLEAVMAKAPGVYQRAGVLVTVHRTASRLDPFGPQVARLEPHYLGPLTTKFVRWVRTVEQEGRPVDVPAHPPVWAAKGLAAMGGWPTIAVLEGVVEFPALRADGTVLETTGYDFGTGLLYEPSGPVDPVALQPSLDDAKRACALLKEPFCDFPFDDDPSRSATLAALLTPLARYAFSGPVPLFVVDKNVRGAGGTLLVDTISTILTGRGIPRMAQAEDEGEERKRITTLLLGSEAMVLIDNVGSAFGSAALDALITGPGWKDRLLGANKDATLANRTVWFVTGNNIVFAKDTLRRTLRIRLRSPEENPESREGFRHPRLLEWVRANRDRLLAAALTVLRAYFAAERPPQELRAWGSFEAWSDIVRAALVWSGEPDPGFSRGAGDDVDSDKQTLVELIHGWEELDPNGEGLTIRQVLDRFDEDERRARAEGGGRVARALAHGRLRELFCVKGRPMSAETISTRYLRRFKDRVWDGRALRSDRNRSNVCVWRVTAVGGSVLPTLAGVVDETGAAPERGTRSEAAPSPTPTEDHHALRVVGGYDEML